MMTTGGQRGLELSLPGTMQADFMNMDQPYGIYVNPYTGYIYGTDAGSFECAGYLYQWSPDGQLLGKHKVYINPGHFLALPPADWASSIETIQDSRFKVQNDIYDLHGRRIDNLHQKKKGTIYVENGRKTLYTAPHYRCR